MKKLIVVLFLLSVSAVAQLPTPVQSVSVKANACTFGQNVASGDLLIVGYEAESSTAVTVSDSLSTSWTRVQTNNGSIWMSVFYGVASSSGADTATISSSLSFNNIACAEFSNVTGTLDTSVTGGYSGTPATVTSSSFTTTVGQDLLVGYISGFQNAGAMDTNSTGHFALGFTNGNDSQLLSYAVAGTNAATTLGWTNASNSLGNYAVLAFKAQSALTVVDSAVPDAIKSNAYSYTLRAAGGTGAYTWSITSGSLPTGLSLSSGGVISGAATAGSGTNNITFQVADTGSHTATQAITLSLYNNANTPAHVQGNVPAAGTTVVYPGNVTSGNALLYARLSGCNNSTSVGCLTVPTDTRGTVYRLVSIQNHAANSGGTQTAFLIVFCGTAPSSGANTVSPGNGAGIQQAQAVEEISGVQPGFCDNAAITTGSGATGSPTTVTSSSLTTLSPNEMLWSAATGFSNSSVVRMNAPFTEIGFVSTGGGLSEGYDAVTTVTGYTSSFNISSNGDGHWQISMLGLRPSGSVLSSSGMLSRRTIRF